MHKTFQAGLARKCMHPSCLQHTSQTLSPAQRVAAKKQPGEAWCFVQDWTGTVTASSSPTAWFRNMNFRREGPVHCTGFYFVAFSLSLLFSPSSCITLRSAPPCSLLFSAYCLEACFEEQIWSSRGLRGESCGQNIIKSPLDWCCEKI